MMSFNAFVLSLAATAAVHFGDRAQPGAQAPGEPDLPAASQIIDILTLLEEKTRGNLSTEEARLLASLLYEVRMHFVEATKSPAS